MTRTLSLSFGVCEVQRRKNRKKERINFVVTSILLTFPLPPYVQHSEPRIFTTERSLGLLVLADSGGRSLSLALERHHLLHSKQQPSGEVDQMKLKKILNLLCRDHSALLCVLGANGCLEGEDEANGEGDVGGEQQEANNISHL